MLRRAVKRLRDESKSSGKEGASVQSSKKLKSSSAVLGEAPVVQGEEKVLEKLVLGAEDELLESLEWAAEKKKKVKPVDELSKPTPAWEDEDDDNLRVHVDDKQDTKLKLTSKKQLKKKNKQKKITGEQYKSRLRNEFEKISGTPTWARLRWERAEHSSGEDSDTEDLLKKTGNYLAESESLAQGVIQLKRCTDANKEEPSKGKLKSVQFHKTSQIMLTAGMDHTLHLFQVDGKTNPKIQSVFLDSFPIFTARFSSDGREVIMGSRHKSFYYYDMIAGKVVSVPKLHGVEEDGTRHFEVSPDGKIIAFRGKYGQIHLVSAFSKELISTLKINGTVDALAFSRDGSRLFSVGDDGEVYVWDMHARQCVHKFVDEGCIHGTALAVSQNSQYIACGSFSGVVNIYDDTCLQTYRPKPLKAIMNLTTPCTDMMFNPQTEILALSSNYTEKAVKMVHLPSMTVFANFPDRATDNLRIPNCMDFSTRSGYFTLGNNKGQALLYRVKHYENY